MKTEEATNTAEMMEEGGFSAEAALNTAGFAEFLAKFKDADTFDATNSEELKTRFEAFQNKDAAAENMAELLKEELFTRELLPELGGIENVIAEEIRNMAIENPKKIQEITESIREFDETARQIKEMEAKIAEMKEEGDPEEVIAMLQRKEKALEKAAETEDFWTGAGFATGVVAAWEQFIFGVSVESDKKWLEKNPGKEPTWGNGKLSRADVEKFVKDRSLARERHEARVDIKQEYGISPSPAEIAYELEMTRTDIETMKEAVALLPKLESDRNDLVARFKQMHGYLLSNIGENAKLREAAQKKAGDKIKSLIDTNPEKAQEFFDDLKKATAEGELGVNFIEGDADKIQSEIQTKIEDAIRKDMKKALETTALGAKAYDNMYKSFEKFIKREKAGGKEGDAARKFVLDTLNGVAAEIATKDKAKAIIARFMAAKLANA
ncbi:MAG TPA: hypothetical protein VFT82_01335 [Candidatus Paceibacterota bacterium]|nr:hypothetical protein [Candidatus Paceibacterota bacterium]